MYEDELKDTTPFNRAISPKRMNPIGLQDPDHVAAIDSGKLDLMINSMCQYFEYYGSYIYNWNRKSWGEQDALGCLQHSLNVCLAKIATEN